jgi:hypothetical protein
VSLSIATCHARSITCAHRSRKDFYQPILLIIQFTKSPLNLIVPLSHCFT